MTRKSNKTTKIPKSFLLISLLNSSISITTVSYLQPAIARMVGSGTLSSARVVSIVGTPEYYGSVRISLKSVVF